MKRALYRGKGYEGNNEIWVYGYYVNVCNTPTIVVPDTAEEVVVDLNSVGQFTGLYDRTQWNELSMNEQREWFAMNDSDEWHGRPIFEGDIIKTEDFIAVVKFGEYNDCAIGFYLKCYIGLNNLLENANVNISKEYKVIGNVYDNPELITN